ncbi:MAG: hypothetical protein FXF47_06745 [Candidatus Mcinerneyibacterium aminivorans]|uniref:CARDB domain-containing protein n=1 Tax=Candidatus Mcinerneyibacterium aminivorans TaxID=2703815 RepID=A0A5D0MAY3_9BACT|nr:MAG: hypothetical protein FXF47_06745 [Candidatus Mcinerneyibacterium aminivorans]
MNKYSKSKLIKFIKEFNYKYYTFGEKNKENGKINFNENESILNSAGLNKNNKYLLISDGHIKIDLKNPDIELFPIIPEEKNEFDDIQINDFIIPSTFKKGEKARAKVYLQNISSDDKEIGLSLKINNNYHNNKMVFIEKNSKKLVTLNIKNLNKKLNKITVVAENKDELKNNNSVTGYIKTEDSKKKILILGKLSFEIAYLRKYFDKFPSYQTDQCVKIKNKYFYKNTIFNSKPDFRNYDMIISVGNTIKDKAIDVLISPPGKVISEGINFQKISSKSFFLQNIVRQNLKPSKIFFKIKDIPIIYENNNHIVLALSDLYHYYLKDFMIYDYFMRKIINIHNRINKQTEWEFSNNLLYKDKSNKLLVNNKIPVFFNKKEVIPYMKNGQWVYSFNPHGKNRNVLRIGRISYVLFFNDNIERIRKNPDFEKLKSVGSGKIYKMNRYEIENLINKENKIKMYFSNNIIIYILILLLLTVVWVWEKL